MKNILALLLLTFFCEAKAQSSATPEIRNLYNQNYRSITYLGMDFSKVVLIGDFSEALGVGGNSATKNAYFKAWNNLVTGEFDKYSIKALVNNQNIATELQGVMEMNNTSKIDELSGYKEPDYTKEAIQQHMNDYMLPSDKGLGVIVLMESFNQNTSKAYIDLVVINMTTKEIVLLKKLETTPRGRGLRNYWAGAIYQFFKEVEKNFGTTWKNDLGL